MNFVLALACLFFVYSANALDKEFKEKFIEKLQETGAQCVQEEHASDTDIASLLSHEIPESHEGKCVVFCVHKAFKMLNEDGTLNEEGTLQAMEPLKVADAELYDKMLKLYNICKASLVVDNDPCITSSRYAKCGLEEGIKLGIKDMLEM